jgi:predicted phage terminase large subunit-like protein
LKNEIVIGPQQGPQTMFLSCGADIAIYGGAAGSGKSYALLLDPLRYIKNKNFRANIFRRTTKQVRNSGGLWDESKKIYYFLGGTAKETTLEWTFPSGMQVKFNHIEHENNVYDYQGSQIPMICFDELTHFTEQQFFYMLSRNRSVTGIDGCIRATTNPDSRSWVKKFIQWWIDPDTGFAIQERSGVLRYFVRKDDQFVWADRKEDLPGNPKSVTFIPAKIYDNKILMEKDPTYLANLQALSRFDREQLLDANWNVEPTAGMFFKKHYFEIVDSVNPVNIVKIVRAWDRAATKVDETTPKNRDPDYTCGIKLAKLKDGTFVVMDVVRERMSPFEVEKLTLRVARNDGIETTVKIFQDPGGAGVYEAQAYLKVLSGFSIVVEKIIKDKITAAKPVSAQSEAGNIKLLRAKWNDTFLSELENFPETSHDDQVDAFSSAFNCLNSENVGDFTNDFLSHYQDKDKLEW